MPVTFPYCAAWDPAIWVARRFFVDALPYLSDAPGLASEIERGLARGTYSLGLREASPALLHQAEVLVDRVIAVTLATAVDDDCDPFELPIYLDRLRELRDLVRAAQARPAVWPSPAARSASA